MNGKHLRLWGIGLMVFVIVMAMSAIGVYWFYFRIDYTELADQQIAEGWIGEAETVPALSFFAAGGRFIDAATTPAETSIDRGTIVPMLTELEREAKLNWMVSLSADDRQRAYALVAQLTEKVDEEQLDRIVQVARQSYAGRILLLKGEEWISLEFTAPRESR